MSVVEDVYASPKCFLDTFVIDTGIHIDKLKMSGKALGDLNVHPAAGFDKSTALGKGSLTKSYIENINDNGPELQKKSSSPFSAPINIGDAGSNGLETGNTEVEYIESENLADLPDVDAIYQHIRHGYTEVHTLLARLDSKDWVSVCEALNNVRQLSIYYRERLLEIIGAVIPLIVKSLRSPRSAVCKTAIMASADIFKAYNDMVIDSFDPLLVQLLLKSSQDKRFVCEAAEAALIAMTTWISPMLLLPKLLPHLTNRNPRIRAKASMCFSRSVPRLGMEGIRAYGIDKLIQIAASQLSDQLPESREAARTLAMQLQTIYVNSQVSPNEDSLELVDADSWEAFCHAKLTPLSAQAILRVTSTPKEALREQQI
ncbi:CLASP N terminal [Musa troglodytarum]|uniref:CLASP N terminal n=1 Tax=Musa troglodytarum TaxID=320322 RepID=A0A9E7KK97_9LILI|nr:CLASP N terminal [Musa troglodytarum]